MNAKVSFSFLSSLLLVLFTTQLSFAKEPAEVLVRKAVSENAIESAAAIEELRALGPSGLQALLATYAGEINRQVADPMAQSNADWQRISKALDAVSGQKNSYLAGLYWHTSLKEAQQASLASKKPILSLRLLGKLTDELSCANSRYFRTVLYANDEVASVLREGFVLHWQTERPAPIVTIDFGDGRKIETTITGNSIHYVLDSTGRPIDALPGLHGPKAFLRHLAEARTLFGSLFGKTDAQKNFALHKYYRDRLNKISIAWYADVAKIGDKAPEKFVVSTGVNGEVTAVTAAPLAITKMLTEANVLRGLIGTSEELGRITDEAAWRKIAQLHSPESVLDRRSISLIKRQNPSLSGPEFAAMVERFQESVALDTVRNEYLMRSKLYTWLLPDAGREDLEKLNEKVYAELFLTPRADQWLGLLSAGVYAALDNGGIK